MVDINLVPQEVKVEQERTQVVKRTTLAAVAFAILVAAGAVFLLAQAQSIKSETSRLNARSQSLRGDINALSEIEILARNLDVKSKTVESVMSGRSYYSFLLTEIKRHIPETVTVDTFGTAKDNTVNVAGLASDYLAIAQFVNNLSDNSTMFTDVSLNSVSLDSQTSLAKFFIILTLDTTALKR